jgi:hypothetical protein
MFSNNPDLGEDEFKDDLFAESNINAFGVSPTKRTTSASLRPEVGKERSAEDVQSNSNSHPTTKRARTRSSPASNDLTLTFEVCYTDKCGNEV